MKNKNRCRLMIADDHQIVISGIKESLKDNPEIEIVGEASTGRETLKKTQVLLPDILILDIAMPELNGIDTARRIVSDFPDIRIIIYTMNSNDEFIIELLKIGVSAFVLKEDPVSELILAVKSVIAGGTYFSGTAHTVVQRYLKSLENLHSHKNGFDSLSIREREVFQLLAEGNTIREIAEKLHVSTKTVETHKYKIFSKLSIHSMTDLIKLAIRKKIIPL